MRCFIWEFPRQGSWREEKEVRPGGDVRGRELWVHPTLAAVSAAELGCLRRDSMGLRQSTELGRGGHGPLHACLSPEQRSPDPGCRLQPQSRFTKVAHLWGLGTLPTWDTLMVSVYPELPELEPVPQVTPSSAPSCLLHLPSQVWALTQLQLR